MTEYSTPATKKCTKCGEHKPLDAFSPHRTCKYGRNSWCKECANAKRRDQYATDAEYREQKSLYHRMKFADDNQYRANVLRQGLRWKRANLDRHREHVRESRKRHPERISKAITTSPKYLARLEVRKSVLRNDFPPAWGLVCEICQEAQAAQYHHWHGYDEQYRLDVIAVCRECHGKEHSIWDKEEQMQALHEGVELARMRGSRN